VEANKPAVTGLKKRQQIQQANKTVFIWVTIASALVAIAIVMTQFLYKEFMFNARVIAAKQTTNARLKSNLEAYQPLKEEVGKLLADKDLTRLRVRPEDTALQTIIDAMPTYDDRVAFATSLQRVVLVKSGVGINVLAVQEGAIGRDGVPLAAIGTTSYIATEMPFTVTFGGSYGQLYKAFQDMQHSIRPISVNNIKLSGSGDILRVDVQAVTYYASPRSIQLLKESIK